MHFKLAEIYLRLLGQMGVARVLDEIALDSQEGSSITDAPGILATLYPALLKLAQAELAKRGFGIAEAEDLVQSAATEWFAVTVTEDAAYLFMRAKIRNRVRDLDREDHPLSLNTPIRGRV